VRYAARQVWKSRGFASVTLLTLALCIDGLGLRHRAAVASQGRAVDSERPAADAAEREIVNDRVNRALAPFLES
jgi:hypothetical protein